MFIRLAMLLLLQNRLTYSVVAASSIPQNGLSDKRDVHRPLKRRKKKTK